MSVRLELPGNSGPLRILYLARGISYPGSVSGAQRRITSFLSELRRLRVPTLAYVAPPVERPSGGRVSIAGRLVPAAVRGSLRDATTIASSVRWAAAELDAVRAFRPSIVLERAAYLDVAGARVAGALAIPHVLELHGLLDRDARGYYHSLLAPLGSVHERRRYRAAAATIVVSEGLRRHLLSQRVRPECISVIPNGTDPAAVVDPSTIAATRRRWGISDERVVGWIGHLMLWQVPSFVLLLRALERVAQDVRVALVVVAPEGAGTRAIEAAASASVRVVCAGEAPGGEALPAVAAFDVGVVPSARPYDLPVKLFQYGAAAVPIVAPAAESILALEGSGDLHLFAPDNADALASALTAALCAADSPDRAVRFRRIVEERYLWRDAVERTIEFLRRL